MWCPFYWGNSMCGARNPGLYVPSKEIEIMLCTTRRHTNCPKYKKARKNLYPEMSEEKPEEKEAKAPEFP